MLDNLTNFIMDNISDITSIRNITNSLNKFNNTLNHKTIGSYIQYLCNAFLFYKIKRYDIQGKHYLESQDKYHLVDPTFKYAKLYQYRGSWEIDSYLVIEKENQKWIVKKIFI